MPTLSRIRSSFQSLRNLRVLIVVAMFTALQVVLSGVFGIMVTPTQKVSIDFLMLAATGMLYGPVVAGLQGVMCDLLSFLLFPKGPYFPGYTLSALLYGLIYGFVLYKRPWTWQRLLLSKAIVNVFINIGLNTLWGILLYGQATLISIWPRVAKNLLLLPVEVLLMVGLTKILRRLAPKIPGYQANS